MLFLVSSLIREVIYFDSYLNEFYFIQMKSLCCELTERQRERGTAEKRARSDKKNNKEQQ